MNKLNNDQNSLLSVWCVSNKEFISKQNNWESICKNASKTLGFNVTKLNLRRVCKCLKLQTQIKSVNNPWECLRLRIEKLEAMMLKNA